MANWSTAWVPSYPMAMELEFLTKVSPYESGAEQRRQKWSSPKYHFFLSFDVRAVATIDAIKDFFVARAGAYDSFNFPCFGQRIKGATLACAEGGASPDTITDSGSGFVLKGFDASHGVAIAGSGAGNDGFYGLQTVIAGTLTLDTAEDIVAESANASLIVYKTYVVRFNEDRFRQEWLVQTAAGLYLSGAKSLELIEVL